MQNAFSKDQITVYGQRNWERVVELAAARADDRTSRKRLADALAALVSELTPAHREVLAEQYLTCGAQGRLKTWPLPPAVTGGRPHRERWAALVLLDCVDRISDDLSADHSIHERLAWRAAAERYTRGAEKNPLH